MVKALVGAAGAGLALASGISSAFAAEYQISTGSVTDIGSAATDTATSAFGMIGDLLPVLVPLIVFGLGFMLVKRVFPRV